MRFWAAGGRIGEEHETFASTTYRQVRTSTQYKYGEEQKSKVSRLLLSPLRAAVAEADR